ncbi:hypothetical protein ACPPVO_21710 [Dactylosporangium sp. McL0621]|uniref:hypothetical protein n=1 Tax=Dactylosporangium sp. McL0621 TaxID=3415678 RepID=UPI003CF75F8D
MLRQFADVAERFASRRAQACHLHRRELFGDQSCAKAVVGCTDVAFEAVDSGTEEVCVVGQSTGVAEQLSGDDHRHRVRRRGLSGHAVPTRGWCRRSELNPNYMIVLRQELQLT